VKKAPTKRFLLLLGAFLFSGMLSFGQFSFDANCRDAYRSILFLKFDEARHHLDVEKQLKPTNRIPVFLENYIDFLSLFIDENPEQFTKLNGNEYSRLKFLEQADKNSPYYRYCIAQVRLQWAFVRLKFGEYFTAASEIKKASHLLEANVRDYPDFVMNYTGLGVVHTMAGLVPDQYKWLANLLGFEGSVDEGVNDLTRVVVSDGKEEELDLFKTETLFYLTFIELNLKKDRAEAYRILALSQKMLPDENGQKSPLLIYSLSSVYMRTGNNDLAISLLAARPLSPEFYPFHYLDFMLGLARLNRLDKNADQAFTRFLKAYPGTNYVKAAYQKIAWYWLLEGDEKKYGEYMKLVYYLGNAIVDEDKIALKEAEGKMPPNNILLRARLLCDGGYYDRAFDELLNRSVNEIVGSKKDLIEYSYRLGRIYHESGNLEKANLYYEQTIRNGSGEPYYFAASAALQMGLMKEQKGNATEARKYYQMCLSMHYDEYKNSLSQKAKAGLKRVNR
jgi:hypothetical protein